MTLNDEKVDEIKRLRKAGYTLREIAERCGVSLRTVWRYSQNIMPDRDYLELKLKDMRDTMNSMKGLINVMISERDKCWKACADCERVIKSLQEEKDRTIFEIRQQKDDILGNLASEIERIKTIVDTLMSAKNDIERKYREICEFRDRLRGLLIELASLKDRIDDERWISYFNQRINEMLGHR
jgi:transcriptional regulator with XRE-family HTH domain